MFARLIVALASAAAAVGLMVFAGQPAAAAEPVTIPAAPAYEAPVLYGSSLDSYRWEPSKKFTVWHDPWASTYRIALQLKSGTSWKTVGSKAPGKQGKTTLGYKMAKEGTVHMRIAATEGGRTLASSPAQKVTWKRDRSDIHHRYSNYTKPFAEAEGKVAAGDQARHGVYVWTGRSARIGALQMHKNGQWVTVQKLVWKKKSSGTPPLAIAKTPKTQSNVTRKYRIVVNASAYEKGWTSKTGTVRHENPRSYTGYRKLSYDYMKKYCPNQIITVKKGGSASTAHSGSLRIEMAPGYQGSQHKAIALHECAHIITFRLYGNGLEAMDSRLNKIFKSSNGVEMVADCMAYRMGADPKAAVNWYTQDCKGSRGTAAKNILAGKKP
ncbi:hypothetical protein [Arthrobacter sulfonylureivorans]|uniref:SprT-like domain-containing protein n=1 Tax=Arthrobacter sulfonylureivorans TaxID=2486855 RepID=A0ABY3WAG1_9MICC|nr:hypothetical protein [Arthrobacter sulfonylureivorans]UNK46190.1 hypothetical protein MNQ99_02135 [Arthrobacter sulfonylureivorans]